MCTRLCAGSPPRPESTGKKRRVFSQPRFLFCARCRSPPRALASRQTFQLERACLGLDTLAGENNNRNTPYLQTLRFARPEATLNDLVSHCKRFGRITKKSQFDGDAQGARCTNSRRFMPSGTISQRSALPVEVLQTYSAAWPARRSTRQRSTTPRVRT